MRGTMSVAAIGLLVPEGDNVQNVALAPIVVLANLYGVVTDAQTGYALSGVKVTIDDLVTYTDASGNYGFEGLSPGTYTITFEKEGYETATGDVTLVEGNNEQNVPLNPIAVFDPWSYDFNGDGIIDSDEAMAAANDYLDGKIRYEDSLAVANLFGTDACKYEGRTYCRDYNLWVCRTGHLALEETNSPECGYIPPFDPWVYDVNGDGYIDASEEAAAVADWHAGIITTEQMLQVSNLPSPPAPPTANLYGVVTDAQTGSPLSGVKVTIDGLVTYTDASGNYGFEGLAPGSYTITFEKEGYETVTR